MGFVDTLPSPFNQSAQECGVFAIDCEMVGYGMVMAGGSWDLWGFVGLMVMAGGSWDLWGFVGVLERLWGEGVVGGLRDVSCMFPFNFYF